jgi:hypothetical protein
MNDRSVPDKLAERRCGDSGFGLPFLEYDREVLGRSLRGFHPPGNLSPPIRLIFLTRVRYIARLEMRFSWKKSNCAATSSTWEPSRARYPMVEKSRTISRSSPRLVPFPFSSLFGNKDTLMVCSQTRLFNGSTRSLH